MKVSTGQLVCEPQIVLRLILWRGLNACYALRSFADDSHRSA